MTNEMKINRNMSDILDELEYNRMTEDECFRRLLVELDELDRLEKLGLLEDEFISDDDMERELERVDDLTLEDVWCEMGISYGMSWC